MKRVLPFTLFMLLGLSLMAGLVSSSARAVPTTTITVNTSVDENNTNGNCSLREAIIAANINGPVDGCPAGSGADTIILPAGIYVLTIPGTGEDTAGLTGDLDIVDDLTIQGAGKAVTIISGNGIDRVFDIFDPAQISDVTISDGDAGTDLGGGIRVNANGSLTLVNSRVRDNSAITGGGLFILNGLASATLIDTRVYNNHAVGLNASGGGISNYGNLTLLNSLVSGNTANYIGGGIQNTHTAVLVNSTISGNSAFAVAGGLQSTSLTSLYNVTITNNEAGTGGGVQIANGTLNAKNTLFSDNIDSDPSTPDPDCSGTITSLGYNLISDTSGCTINGTTGNLLNVSANLGPLQNNGGPTLTHALLASSPAIDAGEISDCYDADGAPLTTDQRGFVRPVDGDGNGNVRCDMGAFEYNSPGTPTVTPSPTTTYTATPTITSTSTPTNTPTNTGTPPPSSTITSTPSPTSTLTPGPSPTASATSDLTPPPTVTSEITPTPGIDLNQVFLPFIKR